MTLPRSPAVGRKNSGGDGGSPGVSSANNNELDNGYCECNKSEYFKFVNFLYGLSDKEGLMKVVRLLKELKNVHLPFAGVQLTGSPSKESDVVEIFQWLIMAGIVCFKEVELMPWNSSWVAKKAPSEVGGNRLVESVRGSDHGNQSVESVRGGENGNRLVESVREMDGEQVWDRSVHAGESDPLANAVVRMCEKQTDNLLLSGSYRSFSGTNTAEFGSWLRTVKNRVQNLEVCDRVKLLHLEQCLSGAAYTEYVEQNKNPTWMSALQYLTTRYTDPFSDSKQMGKFTARVQLANESIADFGRALKTLCPLFPHERLYNSTLVGQLKAGVSNVRFKAIVGKAARLGTASFDDVLTQLIVEEDVDRELYGRSGRNSGSSAQGGSFSRQSSGRDNFRQFCTFCSKMCDHVVGNCPFVGGGRRYGNSYGGNSYNNNNSGRGYQGYQGGRQAQGSQFTGQPNGYSGGPSATQGQNRGAYMGSGGRFANAGPPNRTFGGQQTGRTGTYRCFTCGQDGHRSFECSNRNQASTGQDRVRSVVFEPSTSKLEQLVSEMKLQLDSVQLKLQGQESNSGQQASVSRVGMVRLPVRQMRSVPCVPPAPKTKLFVEGVMLGPENWILDSGSVNSLVSLELVNQLGLKPKACTQQLVAVNETIVNCLGTVSLSVEVAGRTKSVECHVTDHSNTPFLLGVRALKDLNFQIVGPDGLCYLNHCDQLVENTLVAQVREKIPLSEDEEEALFVFRDENGSASMIAQVSLVSSADQFAGCEDTGDEDAQLGNYCELPTATLIDKEETQSREKFLAEVKISDAVNEVEQGRLKDVLWACRTAFSSSYVTSNTQNVQDLGRVQVTHKIDTKDEPPFKMAERRLPLTQRIIVQKMVADLLEKGLIVETSSPYCSAVVLARKADGSLRFCVDYRKLNQQTVKDTFPIGRIDDILCRLGKGRVFSTLDVKCGYYCVPMDPESMHKTAFVADNRIFMWTRMPFGLTNAPATFSRMMKEILHEFVNDFCHVYIDDVLIVSEDVDTHLHHLSLVLRTLAESGLKLNPNKCEFAALEVKFLGHIVSGEGVKVNPKKAEAIANFPLPTTRQDMQSFMGLVSYLRKFQKDLAKRVAPLQELVVGLEKPKSSLSWTPELKDLFKKLCAELSNTPTLSRPMVACGCVYIMFTDACLDGMGVMLQQQQPDGLKLIEFGSRCTTKAERNYAATELEMRAVIFGLDKFHVYLLGEKLILMTDHKPLIGLMKKDLPSPKLYRWAMIVQQYDIEIKYVPGKENLVADALSRAPLVCRMQTRLQFQNKQRLLKLHHQGPAACHSGVEATYQALKQFYGEVWPGMKSDVKRFVESCNICKQRSARYEILPQLNRPPPQQPRVCWHMDFCEIRKSSAVPYCLVLIDGFSRWMIVCPTKSQNGKTTIKGLEKVILHFGVPAEVVSDQGSHFCSQLVQEYLAGKGIKHEVLTAGGKTANALVERANRSFQDVLSKRMAEEGRNLNSWHSYAEAAAMAYNIKPHQSLGFLSPFHVVYGVPYSSDSTEFVTTGELSDFWAKVRVQIVKAQEQYTTGKFFDRTETRFKVGDGVFVKSDALRAQRKLKIDLANEIKGVVKEVGRRSALVELEGVKGRFKTHRVPLAYLQPRALE